MRNFDLLIQNATIIDGTGTPSYKADVAISKNKIAAVGPCIQASARKTLDAKGLILCPGFIDIHGHTDHYLCVDPQASSKILQGVTTEVFGNCGYSPFFLKGKFRQHFKSELDECALRGAWHDLESFSKRVAESRPALNWMTLMGHGTLRRTAMGSPDRAPSPDEMKWMTYQLEKALDQGAVGLSTGLIYTPGCFAKIQEIVELVKVVGSKKGLYATHMRSEGDKLLESVQESLRIAQKGKAALQISHLKTAGEKNWKKIDDLFALLDTNLCRGMDLTWDRYPYTASYTSLDTYLPRSLFDGGDHKAVRRLKNARKRNEMIRHLDSRGTRFGMTLLAGIQSKKNKRWNGYTLEECARLTQESLSEFTLDLLIEEEMQVNAMFFSMSEDNLDRIILHPKAMVGSDASARTRGGKTYRPVVHPRTYGTFPRFLSHFALETKKISLEEAIHKMTGLPASRLGLKKRGVLVRDAYADLVLFNPQTLKDQATYRNPTLDPQGLEMVMVNGVLTVEKGVQTTKRAGVFIRYGES